MSYAVLGHAEDTGCRLPDRLESGKLGARPGGPLCLIHGCEMSRDSPLRRGLRGPRGWPDGGMCRGQAGAGGRSAACLEHAKTGPAAAAAAASFPPSARGSWRGLTSRAGWPASSCPPRGPPAEFQRRAPVHARPSATLATAAASPRALATSWTNCCEGPKQRHIKGARSEWGCVGDPGPCLAAERAGPL